MTYKAYPEKQTGKTKLHPLVGYRGKFFSVLCEMLTIRELKEYAGQVGIDTARIQFA